MKVHRFLVLWSIVFMLSWLCISDVEAKSKWPRSSGYICWEFTHKGVSKGVIKYRVMNMGGGYYFLSSLAEGKELFYGTAAIGEDKVYITTTSAGGDSSGTWTFIGRWVLDKETLDGTGEEMGVGHEKDNPDPENAYTDYDGDFTLKFVKCP